MDAPLQKNLNLLHFLETVNTTGKTHALFSLFGSRDSYLFEPLLHIKMDSTVNFNVVFLVKKIQNIPFEKTFILKIPRLYCFLKRNCIFISTFTGQFWIRYHCKTACLTTFGPFIKDVISIFWDFWTPPPSSSVY